MGSPDRGALLQHVLRRTLAVPARRQAFLDEVCGVNAEPVRRAAVTGWLATHPTPRRLTSEDADERRAVVVSLADVLGDETAARRLVAASRRALRRLMPPAAAILALAEEVRTGVTAPRAAPTAGHGPADTVPAAVLEARWRRAEEDGDAAAAVGCALTSATRDSRDADPPPELVVAMVTIGSPQERWSVATALDSVGRMTDAREQARAVAMLSAATGDRPGWPWEQALATAERIVGGEPRATAVVALLPACRRVVAGLCCVPR